MVNPWADAWGAAFGGGRRPPLDGAPTIGFQGVGWLHEVEPPAFLLCDLLGRPIVELPMVSWSVNNNVNTPLDMDVSIDTTVNPDLIRLLQPWEQTIIMLAGGEPVGGGTVTKRRTSLGKTVTQVGVKCWTAWLSRVWTTATTEYLAPVVLDDAGVVMHDRVSKAATLADGALRPPLADLTLGAVTGVPYDGDFEDQEYETSPQTFLAQVGVVQQTTGVDWGLGWVEAGGVYKPRLDTFKYDANDPVREVVVGADCATASLEIDTDQQVNRLKIVGALDDVTVGGGASYVPLWRAFSFEDNKDTQTLADQLLAMLDHPTLTITDIQAPGSRAEFTLGDLMSIRIPAGFDARYPDGAETTMQVTGINWSGSAAQNTTKYTLRALWEAVTASPQTRVQTTLGQALGPSARRNTDLVGALKDMGDRITRLELRR